MEHGSRRPRRGRIHLRRDAITKLAAHAQTADLGRRQQAALLGIAHTTLWRLTTRDGPVGERAIVDILTAVRQIGGWGDGGPMGFEDLFEIRPAA